LQTARSSAKGERMTAFMEEFKEKIKIQPPARKDSLTIVCPGDEPPKSVGD